MTSERLASSKAACPNSQKLDQISKSSKDQYKTFVNVNSGWRDSLVVSVLD